MEIQKIGNNAFYVKGKKGAVVINPSKEQLDLKKFEARIIAVSNKDEDMLGEWHDGKVFLRGPGEYEVGGIDIVGINSGVGSTIYIFEVDGFRVCFLGKLDALLSDKKVEKIDDVDVLMAPLDGKKLGNGKNLMDWAKKWGANYVIPFGYEESESDLVNFLDAADKEGNEAIESLKVSSRDELPDGTDVVVLK